MLRTRLRFDGKHIKIGDNVILRPYLKDGKPEFSIEAPREVNINLNCEDAKNGNETKISAS